MTDTTISTENRYQGFVDGIVAGCLCGWCYNFDQPDETVELSVCLGDRVVGTVVADLFRIDLLRQGMGNGHHSFAFPLDMEDGKLNPD